MKFRFLVSGEVPSEAKAQAIGRSLMDACAQYPNTLVTVESLPADPVRMSSIEDVQCCCPAQPVPHTPHRVEYLRIPAPEEQLKSARWGLKRELELWRLGPLQLVVCAALLVLIGFLLGIPMKR
jgi:hypothetical protein